VTALCCARCGPRPPLAQLNNPLGGILRCGDAVAELYDRILDGLVRLEVTFGDIVEYLGHDHALFAGRETGTYTDPGGADTPLEIRTSRYFRYQDGPVAAVPPPRQHRRPGRPQCLPTRRLRIAIDERTVSMALPPDGGHLLSEDVGHGETASGVHS
jgi:hypothetical protein